ncbi:unnamed protein product [Closterium sp. Naga37s-1]|nr:unnamed protein product [Closterium sp. Naga37s-1]
MRWDGEEQKGGREGGRAETVGKGEGQWESGKEGRVGGGRGKGPGTGDGSLARRQEKVGEAVQSRVPKSPLIPLLPPFPFVVSPFVASLSVLSSFAPLLTYSPPPFLRSLPTSLPLAVHAHSLAVSQRCDDLRPPHQTPILLLPSIPRVSTPPRVYMLFPFPPSPPLPIRPSIPPSLHLSLSPSPTPSPHPSFLPSLHPSLSLFGIHIQCWVLTSSHLAFRSPLSYAHSFCQNNLPHPYPLQQEASVAVLLLSSR